MSKKNELDARRVLQLLAEPGGSPRSIAEKVGASPEAVDEARVLLEELSAAEVDAILALPPVLGRALLQAAAKAGRQDVLLEAAGASDKELQREAKRIAHSLRLQGVEVALPARAEPPPVAPASTEPPTAEPPVFASALDTVGERALYWTRMLPGRGVEVAQLVLSDTRGVVHASIAELSRKRFRELCDELPREGRLAVRELPRERARALLDRARRMAREGGQVPGAFVAWSAQVLGPLPPSTPEPLAPEGAGRAPEERGEREALALGSEALRAEPELALFGLEDAELRRLATVATPASDEAALQAASERLVEQHLDDARRSLWAARLLDTAFLLERDGRTVPARQASATATQLRAGVPVAQLGLVREVIVRLREVLALRTPRPDAAREAPRPA